MSVGHRVGADQVGMLLAEMVAGHSGVRVVDVGGGSGTRAVPLARLGCRVTVVDSSTDALASLRLRAAEAGVAAQIDAVQADADQLGSVLPPGRADLVLCHLVLETVEDPAVTIAALAGLLRAGGQLSVLVAGRLSAAVAQALAGRFDAAAAVLADPEGRAGPADPLRRRFDVDSLAALLTSAGLELRSVTGVGVVSGLATGAGGPAPLEDGASLARVEQQFGRHPVLRQLGGLLHAVARA